MTTANNAVADKTGTQTTTTPAKLAAHMTPLAQITKLANPRADSSKRVPRRPQMLGFALILQSLVYLGQQAAQWIGTTINALPGQFKSYFAGRATTTANPFGAYKCLRTVSAGVLICFSSVTMSPAIAAIRADNAEQERRAQAKTRVSALEQFTMDMKRLEAALAGDNIGAGIGARKLETKLTQPATWINAGSTASTPAAIIDTLTRDDTQSAIEAEFAATDAHLKKHNLAPEIHKRHADTVAAFRAKHAEFIAAARTGGEQRHAALRSIINKNQSVTQKKDFNNLSWRSHAAKAREPITDARQLKQLIEAAPTNNATNKSAQAAATDKKSSSLTAAPDAADLAENTDAQLTPAIRAKATELNNHPVTIYNWVRNNIRFIPSYGSVQGADDTLNKLAGNAFDTASLLIALYRAANIPARYVYGTIELPAEQVMNWVGGVSNADAAQQLLLQGGIPNVALTSGGQITTFRLETVWVEAWLNYYPSRGAKHTPYVNLADAQVRGTTWIPMDASIKRMQYTTGMDLKAGVPFDANAFLTAAQQGATVNQSEGWVQNLNQTNIQNQLSAYQNQLSAYVNTQKPNNTATVGDVLGTERIIPNDINGTPPTMLAGSLPYKVITTNTVGAPSTTLRYATLPDNLRHQFQYKLYADANSRNLDNPVISYQQSLPNLAGKKVTLSFTPATQADADLIASYLPQPNANGTPINPNQFPSQIPAYAKVKTQLRVEGVVVAEGGNFTLGQELAGRGGFTTYNLTDWDLTNDETLIAGQATAIGLSIQGISADQLTRLKARMEQTQATVQALQSQTNPTIPTSLTGDTISGDILMATIWGYYAALQSHGELAKRQANMIDRPGMSYGLFHAKAQPVKTFGIVTTAVKFPGVEMDIGHLRHIRWAKNNQQAEWVAYNRLRGQYASGLEHATPEHFFTNTSSCNLPTATSTSTPVYDPAKPACAEGISAVKALAVAQSQGQKVFTITNQNINAVLPQLTGHSQQTRADVQNATNAGKEVTISQSRITHSGWLGAGYVIIDPQTGAGSYLIEGGANGGVIILALLVVLSIAFFEVLAVYYISGVALELIITAGTLATGLILESNFNSTDQVKISGLAFLSTLLMIGLFVTSGYWLVPALFLVAMASAAGFMWEFGKAIYSFLNPRRGT